jgi:TPR repeat protein
VLEALAGAVGNHAVPSDTSAAAMRELGHMHLRGEGVTADAAVAVRHYEHAAELGDTESQSILGVLHSTGFGAPRDAPLAATYMYFAAEGGDIHAQLAMGYRHLLGVAATKACHKSLLYYTPVAEKVVANAQRHQSGGTIEKVRRHIVLRVHIAAATAFES